VHYAMSHVEELKPILEVLVKEKEAANGRPV
jgi:hypothetical protein